jgi:hypothetical protein
MKKRLFGILIAVSSVLASTAPSSSQELGRMFCDSPLSFFCPAPPPPPPPPPVADVPPPMAPPVHHAKKKIHKKKAPKAVEQPAAAPQ